MKIKYALPAALLVFHTMSCALHAGIVTLTATISTTGTATSQFIVPTNVTAQIIHFHKSGGGGNVKLVYKDVTILYTEDDLNAAGSKVPIVTGPATIIITAYTPISPGTSANSICTISTNEPNQFTPTTGVVIPSDAGGPVTIILESSVDLINWTVANPGTYGTSTTNRFFRVRATR